VGFDRDDAAPLVLAALAVVAIAAAAASLDSAVAGGGDGIAGGTDGSAGPESGVVDRPGLVDAPLTSSEVGGVCLPLLRRPAVVAGLLLFLAAVGAAAYWDTGALLPAVVVPGAVAVPIAIVYVPLAFCGAAAADPGLPLPAGEAANGSIVAGGGGSPGGVAGSAPSLPTLALGGLLAVAVAASAALLLLTTASGDDDGGPPEDPPEAGPDPAAVAAAAGDAADRIESGEDAASENGVYRAWERLAVALEMPAPAASTPGEFADAAVEAGLDPDRVAELTELFAAVRYGDAPPTPERERRAVAALRDVEASAEGAIDGDGGIGPPGPGGRTDAAEPGSRTGAPAESGGEGKGRAGNRDGGR
jgi:hypothetical protein